MQTDFNPVRSPLPTLTRSRSLSAPLAPTTPLPAAEKPSLRRASISNSPTQSVLVTGHPTSLAADREAIESLHEPPAALAGAALTLQEQRLRRTSTLALVLKDTAVTEDKSVGQKLLSVLIGGNERGSEARQLADSLRESGTTALADQVDSWGKWEGRVESGGLLQKLPQAGSTVTAAIRYTASEASTALQTAGNIAGAVASGAQILVEGAELRHNLRKHSEASARQQQAETLLRVSALPADALSKHIDTLDQQITQTRAEQAHPPKLGWFRSLFTSKAEQTAKIENKLARLEAEKAVCRDIQAHGCSPQARAVAQQVIDSAATGFKKFRVLKNVLGIAAGAIGIAVAAGALATPVGWVAAGVSLLALGGCVLYNKYQASKRESAIQNAQEQFKQATDQLAQGGHSPEQTDNLQAQKSSAMMQLLKVSPTHAAYEILEGAGRDDPHMKFMLHQVLNLSEADVNTLRTSPQGRQDLIALIKRGMPIMPKL
jgi:hypothetical protein